MRRRQRNISYGDSMEVAFTERIPVTDLSSTGEVRRTAMLAGQRLEFDETRGGYADSGHSSPRSRPPVSCGICRGSGSACRSRQQALSHRAGDGRTCGIAASAHAAHRPEPRHNIPGAVTAAAFCGLVSHAVAQLPPQSQQVLGAGIRSGRVHGCGRRISDPAFAARVRS